MKKWLWKLKQRFKHQALVLMYHRIATPDTDPWQLTVSPENFEKQLQLLAKMNITISANELAEQLRGGKLRKKSIVVTFDDGYADNYTTALPLLKKWGIPATIFVTSQNIGRQKEFWWDELERILMHTPQLPATLSLPIKGAPFLFNLHQDSSLTEELREKHKGWIAAENSPSLRTQLYTQLWEQLSPLPNAEQQQLLEVLRSWAGIAETPRPAYCCMSGEQLKEMAATEGMTLGGHTITHPALNYYSQEQQQLEIQGGQQFLEQFTDYPVTLFAYPSGKYNRSSVEALKQSGFNAAFTTEQAMVTKKANPFELSRVQVNNWSGDQFEKYLSYWFRH